MGARAFTLGLARVVVLALVAVMQHPLPIETPNIKQYSFSYNTAVGAICQTDRRKA